MKVLILAAGYGTRLYPISKDTPKPLLEINQKPLINYVLDKIALCHDINEVIVITNDKFYQTFESWAQEHSRFKFAIQVINDGTKSPEDRLGSIGDIDFVLKQGCVKEDLLVIGGDNLFDDDLDQVLTFARGKAPSATIGVFDVGNLDEATKFGVVSLDQNKRILEFQEKPAEPKSSLIAMCLYFFPESSLKLIGEYLAQSQKSDKAGDYIQWLSQKQPVYAYQCQGQWFDIGSLESYEAAQKVFKS